MFDSISRNKCLSPLTNVLFRRNANNLELSSFLAINDHPYMLVSRPPTCPSSQDSGQYTRPPTPLGHCGRSLVVNPLSSHSDIVHFPVFRTMDHRPVTCLPSVHSWSTLHGFYLVLYMSIYCPATLAIVQRKWVQKPLKTFHFYSSFYSFVINIMACAYQLAWTMAWVSHVC